MTKNGYEKKSTVFVRLAKDNSSQLMGLTNFACRLCVNWRQAPAPMVCEGLWDYHYHFLDAICLTTVIVKS